MPSPTSSWLAASAKPAEPQTNAVCALLPQRQQVHRGQPGRRADAVRLPGGHDQRPGLRELVGVGQLGQRAAGDRDPQQVQPAEVGGRAGPSPPAGRRRCRRRPAAPGWRRPRRTSRRSGRAPPARRRARRRRPGTARPRRRRAARRTARPAGRRARRPPSRTAARCTRPRRSAGRRSAARAGGRPGRARRAGARPSAAIGRRTAGHRRRPPPPAVPRPARHAGRDRGTPSASVTLVPLLLPRVAAVVVAVLLPEARLVARRAAVSRLIHLALFQKYRCGTSIRTGPPCSAGSGLPSNSQTTHALPPVTSSIGRLVV